MIKPATNDCKSNCPQTEDKNQPYKPPLEKLNYTKAEIDALSPAERDKMAFAKTEDGKYIRTHWDVCEIERMSGKQINDLGILTNPDGSGDRALDDDEAPVDPWWEPQDPDDPPHEYKYEDPESDDDYDYPPPEDHPTTGGTNYPESDPGIPGPGPYGAGGTPPAGKKPSDKAGVPGTYFEPSPDRKFFTSEEMRAMSEEDKRRLGIVEMPNGSGIRTYWSQEDIELLGKGEAEDMGITIDGESGEGTIDRPPLGKSPAPAPKSKDDSSPEVSPKEEPEVPPEEEPKGVTPEKEAPPYKGEPNQVYYKQDQVDRMSADERYRIGLVKLEDGSYMRTYWSKDELAKANLPINLTKDAKGNGTFEPTQPYEKWYPDEGYPDPAAPTENTAPAKEPEEDQPATPKPKPVSETERGDPPNPDMPGYTGKPSQLWYSDSQVADMDPNERRRIGLMKQDDGYYVRTTWSPEEMAKLTPDEKSRLGIVEASDGSGKGFYYPTSKSYEAWYPKTPDDADPAAAKVTQPETPPKTPTDNVVSDQSQPAVPDPVLPQEDGEQMQNTLNNMSEDWMKNKLKDPKLTGIQRDAILRELMEDTLVVEPGNMRIKRALEHLKAGNLEGADYLTLEETYGIPAATLRTPLNNPGPDASAPAPSPVPDPTLPKEEGEQMQKILNNMSDDWMKNKLKDENLTWDQRKAIMRKLAARHIDREPGDKKDLDIVLGLFEAGMLHEINADYLVETLGLESRDIIYRRKPGYVHPEGPGYV